jgi:hypothetical protein
MKSLERALLLFPIVAMALLAPACTPVSVSPWPYTTAADDAAAPDGAASHGGASDAASDQDASGLSGIQANYGPDPLRCDGGLCDTDNYSLCSVAHNPEGSRAVWPLSVLFVVAGLALARRRNGRHSRHSS